MCLCAFVFLKWAALARVNFRCVVLLRDGLFHFVFATDDAKLGATVHLMLFFRTWNEIFAVVDIHRFAKTTWHEAAAVNAFFSQPTNDGIGAALRKVIIVVVRAASVGVRTDFDNERRIVFEHFIEFFQLRFALVADVGLVEVVINVQQKWQRVAHFCI